MKKNRYGSGKGGAKGAKTVRPKGIKANTSKHAKAGGYREMIKAGKKGKKVTMNGKTVYGG